jgi:Xaa-Pro aminopeptidase
MNARADSRAATASAPTTSDTPASDSPPSVDPEARARIVSDRLEIVRRLAADADAGGVVLSTRRDIAWLTLGGELHVVLESEAAVAPIVVTPDRAIVIAPENEADRIADEEIRGLPLDVERVPWHDDAAAAGVIERETGERRDAAGGGVLSGADLEKRMQPVRSRLGPIELERMRWLGRRASEALADAAMPVTRGDPVTEDDAVAALLAPLARAGVRAPVVLAGADERLRHYRHPLPTSSPIEGRLMLVVVGERWGLHVAGTLIADRRPADESQRRGDEAVARVLAAMNDASRPGATLGDVLDIATREYAALGYPDEWLNHHQGGTIGYQGRERIATPGDATRLEAGMAVAWNPSVKGSKAESTAIVVDDGRPEVIVAPVVAPAATGQR